MDGNKKLIDGIVVDYRSSQVFDTCTKIQASPYRLKADINRDCTVGMQDLDLIAQEWLTDGVGACTRADINGDGDVQFEDFSAIASQWQENNSF